MNLETFFVNATYRRHLDRMRLYDFIGSVSDPDQSRALMNIYLHYADVLAIVPGSTALHQAWPGGLKDHLASMCRYGWREHVSDGGLLNPQPYTWDDFVVGVFCHDAEKLAKYSSKLDSRFTLYHQFVNDHIMTWEDIKFMMVNEWHADFGLQLNDAILNAIKYTHGEGADYRKDIRIMQPLAAKLGNADRKSARMYPEEGRGMG